MNGGGWGCIYSHQPLPSRWAFLPSADGPPSWCGRSAPVDQRLKMQRSAVTAISTAILHLMRRQMSDKAVRGRSGRAPWTVREDAKITFYRTVTFGFFWFSPTRRSAPGLGRCSLLYRTVRSVDMCLCSVPIRGVADGPPQGPGRSALSLFFQKASPVRNNLRYFGQLI